ncbi:hypothetical protein DO97_12875 [Neosynechococcus sphagnicola sy1]|uniref:Uncharacterized protein n=1 Tax=Neosynechococcus sphagnicola sy1 TaxID=1497020 RepID=A0A098TMZ6_9CYAN|nr:hypothetical protein [Neosynechococcus sphagnicola]KGF73705.1 hypothetical protein DO97_12875 [Neosynechococcus sphagnicola sy1]
MNTIPDPFQRSNYGFHKTNYQQFDRQQRQQKILRSQVGFVDTSRLKPIPCQGCVNYHGVAYGASYETRILLVCGIHPVGWQGSGLCSDWQPLP